MKVTVLHNIGGDMLKVILLFLLLVIIWGALWVGLASLVLIPAVGESATSTLGTLLGMLVGWGLMQLSLSVGQNRGWIKW
ncbi:hypothetical protein [Escherichia phage J8-65]|uniref:Uncharacterized protein n=1 Tax=Escherichia phage J8-65 TaxID=1536597 RepID=A0A088F6G0_9CAUD|nr:hypothetical protein PI28_gp11 [Escherichia phage J8-65]AIM40513.1 hypothetical protein [Escherichia phage J8-65]